MNEAEVIWINGQAKSGAVERICPGRHIRSNQWKSQWNRRFDSRPFYDYISDYDCVFAHPINTDYISNYQQRWIDLQEAKQYGTRILVSDVAHFTHQGAVESIIHDGGFRGKLKKINEAKGRHVKANLSWWTPIFTPDDVRQVRDHLLGVIHPFLGVGDHMDPLKNQFATSRAFQPYNDGYRMFYFQYGINELCENYIRCYQNGELDFRVLGTFSYKAQVMHAVLVCNGTNGTFNSYPRVATPEEDVNNEAVVTYDRNNGQWVWKPEATATEIRRLKGRQVYPMYRRWEHVSFAFHIPDGWNMMPTPNLEGHWNKLPE